MTEKKRSLKYRGIVVALRVSQDTLNRVKIKCKEENCTVSSYICDAVNISLGRKTNFKNLRSFRQERDEEIRTSKLPVDLLAKKFKITKNYVSVIKKS